MKFLEFVTYLNKIETLSSRNQMVEVLGELLKGLDEKEVRSAIYMIQGRVAPTFIPLEFNFSTKLLLRAFAVYAQKDLTDISEMASKYGDLGLLAEHLVVQKHQAYDLDITQVYEATKEIAQISGKNSQADKQAKFLELFKKLGPVEAKYVSRIIVGKLRLGMSDKSMLDAMSWAVTGDKSLRSKLERAYGVSADLGYIGELCLAESQTLDEVRLIPGIPVASKLVEREKDTKAIMERFEKCFIQPKYDGLRTQIHFSRKGFADRQVANPNLLIDELETVRIFSRNMESLTEMLPEVVQAIQSFKVESIVLDAESIAYDADKDQFFPFQETMKRKRKYDISEIAKSIPLRVFCFDIMELNGESLLDKPLEGRLRLLEEIIAQNKNSTIIASENILVDDAQQLQKHFQHYVDQKLEGLIAKGLGTKYEPGTRNYDWIKLKAASQAELADTIDAVVLGYYYGTGVRTKFGIGALLIGSYDPDKDKFISLAKIGTGIKDAQWQQIKQRLDEISRPEIGDNVIIDKNLIPDVLVSPEIVVVVEADEISQSKVHGSGFSLRFPRLKEFDRDKNADQITNIAELKKLFDLQRSNK